MCRANKKDIDDIKPSYIADLTFYFVDQMSEVLEHALITQKVKGYKTWTVVDEKNPSSN